MDITPQILEQFYGCTHSPVHAWAPGDQAPLCALGFPPEGDPFRTDPALLPYLRNRFPGEERPWLHYELDVICYGLVSDGAGKLLILGPVCLYSHSGDVLPQFARSHALPLSVSLPVMDIMSFSSAVSLLHYFVSGKLVDGSELARVDFSFMPTHVSENYNLQNYVMTRRDEGAAHMAYLTEIEKMQPIVNGDVESIRSTITPDLLHLVDDGAIGRLADQPLKQWEYSASSSIALACRAAVRGGVPPADAYALADVMLQRLSKCTDLPSIIQLQGEVRLVFATCVRDYHRQNSGSSPVENAKAFMRSHLNIAITLEEVAAHVNVSPAHLCRKFKAAEGITPMEYLQRKRIDAAKNLLCYSGNSISYISQYLCFHSQSHFGAVFKRVTGKTPKQYRDSKIST